MKFVYSVLRVKDNLTTNAFFFSNEKAAEDFIEKSNKLITNNSIIFSSIQIHPIFKKADDLLKNL